MEQMTGTRLIEILEFNGFQGIKKYDEYRNMDEIRAKYGERYDYIVQIDEFTTLEILITSHDKDGYVHVLKEDKIKNKKRLFYTDIQDPNIIKHLEIELGEFKMPPTNAYYNIYEIIEKKCVNVYFWNDNEDDYIKIKNNVYTKKQKFIKSEPAVNLAQIKYDLIKIIGWQRGNVAIGSNNINGGNHCKDFELTIFNLFTNTMRQFFCKYIGD